jgi:hypothetical protein
VKVDLRGLTFIDSTGLRALMMAKQRAQSRGTKLSIIPGPRAVMRVFGVVRLLVSCHSTAPAGPCSKGWAVGPAPPMPRTSQPDSPAGLG